MSTIISTRLQPDELKDLDALAYRLNCTRAEAIRAALAISTSALLQRNRSINLIAADSDREIEPFAVNVKMG